jgi:hypothetical protein
MIRTATFRKAWILVAVVSLAVGLLAPAAAAGPDPDDGSPDDGSSHTLERPDRGDSLADHDSATEGIVSSGSTATTQKNIDPRGRGDRFDPGSTTDVWALGNYAYTGTFNSPCGGDPEAGIWIWDVKNANNTEFVGIIPSPTGSRSNDVKAAGMNSGDILVHSNEVCGAGGVGGFEIYNVDDPENPVPMAHVQTDDVNAFLRDNLGFVDFGVHNLFLFTQGSNDYVAAVVESEFGNFQIFDITDPTVSGARSRLDRLSLRSRRRIRRRTMRHWPTSARSLMWMLTCSMASEHRGTGSCTTSPSVPMGQRPIWPTGTPVWCCWTSAT